MTYNSLEISDYDNQPYELYEFSFSGKNWRYTSSDEDQIYLSNTYQSVNIERSTVKQNKELNKANLSVKIPYNLNLADQFIVYPPAEVMSLTVYRLHRTGPNTEVVIIWRGRVINAEWNNIVVELTCEAVFTSLRRPGLRRHYQAQCPHVLYGADCSLALNSFENLGTAISVNGTAITISAGIVQADSYYAGGIFLFFDIDGVPHKRAINSNVGNAVVISYPIALLINNSTIRLYPGCRHIVDDCNTKFSNLLNYGGFPYSPDLNPFEFKTLY